MRRTILAGLLACSVLAVPAQAGRALALPAQAGRAVSPRLTIAGVTPGATLAVDVTGAGFQPRAPLTLRAYWTGAPRPGQHPRYTWYRRLRSVQTTGSGTLDTTLTIPVAPHAYITYTLRVAALNAHSSAPLAVAGTVRRPLAAPAPANGPAVDVAAFRGQGCLAFVWRQQLYLLDGDAGMLRRLAAVGPADDLSNLAWSPDGRWLAYIRVTDETLGNGQLWVVRADGSDAHQVTGLPALVWTASWSPVADTLAVDVEGNGSSEEQLWLATPLDKARELAADGADARWSPDGSMLAYSATLPFTSPLGRSDALYTVPVAGGAPMRRFVAKGDGIELLGWWPNGKGVLFWRDPLHSASIAADGLMLYTLPLGAPTPHPLTTTLTYPDWIARSPSGRRLLLVSGAGREAWHGKSLATCDVVTAACQALPIQPGTVALDPAWSPQGNRIAFVQARDLGSAGGFGGAQPLEGWIQTHTLWVATANGAGAHELTAAGDGVYQPRWSYDGQRLLYIRGDAIWLVDANGGAPVKIVGPFPGAPPRFGYYGHVDWTQYIPLAWYQS